MNVEGHFRGKLKRSRGMHDRTEKIQEKPVGFPELEQYAKDGRLTEPSDGKIFDYRKMLEIVMEIGRPLTEQEAGQYRIR